MFLPLMMGLLPSLVSMIEKLIPQSGAGNEKKELAMAVIKSLYEKFLKGKIPDIAGIDEEELFLELSSFMIDFVVKKTLG